MNKDQLNTALEKAATSKLTKTQIRLISGIRTVLESQAFADFYNKDFGNYISGNVAHAIEEYCLVGDPSELTTPVERAEYATAAREAAVDVIEVRLAELFRRLL